MASLVKKGMMLLLSQVMQARPLNDVWKLLDGPSQKGQPIENVLSLLAVLSPEGQPD